MSDTSQGIGWWQASDGKWYSPDLYPKDWAAQPSTEPAAVETSTPVEVVDDPPPTELGDPGPPAWSPPASDEPAEVPLAAAPQASAPPVWKPPVLPSEPVPVEPSAPPVWEPPQTAEPALPQTPDPAPPSGWAAPDPASGEPTLVQGIDPIAVSDPTTVQPVVTPAEPPAPPPLAPPTADPAPAEWTAPAAPPSVWDPPAVPPLEPRTMAQPTSADLPSGLLGLGGGAALIVGSFLAWAKAGGTLTSGTVNGLTGSNGWGTLVAGLVAASCAGLLLAGVRKIWVGAGLALAAIVGLVLAVYSYIDIGNTSDDLPGVLTAQGVGTEIANGAVLDYDLGLWIVLAGGAVVLLGGLVALARRR